MLISSPTEPTHCGNHCSSEMVTMVKLLGISRELHDGETGGSGADFYGQVNIQHQKSLTQGTRANHHFGAQNMKVPLLRGTFPDCRA